VTNVRSENGHNVGDDLHFTLEVIDPQGNVRHAENVDMPWKDVRRLTAN